LRSCAGGDRSRAGGDVLVWQAAQPLYSLAILSKRLQQPSAQLGSTAASESEFSMSSSSSGVADRARLLAFGPAAVAVRAGRLVGRGGR